MHLGKYERRCYMNTELLRPFIESAENLRITNIIVYQNGERIAEHHWDEEISVINILIQKALQLLLLVLLLAKAYFH